MIFIKVTQAKQYVQLVLGIADVLQDGGVSLTVDQMRPNVLLSQNSPRDR